MMKRWFLSFGLWTAISLTARAGDVAGSPISGWQPGMLDIHQISSGPVAPATSCSELRRAATSSAW